MSTTIYYNHYVNGTLTNATSVELESEDDTYGIKTVPGGIVVVASGTAMENFATGRYRYTFNSTVGAVYQRSIKIVRTGLTYYDTGQFQSGDQPTTTTTGTFTSRAEIERTFSQDGVDFRVDDDPNNALVLDDIITDATEMVYQYTWTNYREADLSTSSWIRRRATYIACYLLSLRRGNPAQYVDRFNAIILELQAVYQRQLLIPRLPVLADSAPALSIQVVDNRGLAPTLKVLGKHSIGTYPGQPLASTPPEVF